VTTDGGLRGAESLCGAAEMKFINYSEEGAEMPEFHIDSKLRSNDADPALDRKCPHVLLSGAMKKTLPLLLAAAGLVTSLAAETPVSSVVRVPLLTAKLDPAVSVERVEIKALTIGPGLKTGLHRHPCPVVGVIQEGQILFQVEGEPSRVLKPGDAFFEPPHRRMLHFDTVGDTAAKFTAYYLLTAPDQPIIEMLKE
jgi:quercetin dioxygenase-like cupin family protein